MTAFIVWNHFDFSLIKTLNSQNGEVQTFELLHKANQILLDYFCETVNIETILIGYWTLVFIYNLGYF